MSSPEIGLVLPMGDSFVDGSAMCWSGIPIRGSSEEIADACRTFGAAGYTNLELEIWPPTQAAVDAMAPVIEMLRGA